MWTWMVSRSCFFFIKPPVVLLILSSLVKVSNRGKKNSTTKEAIHCLFRNGYFVTITSMDFVDNISVTWHFCYKKYIEYLKLVNYPILFLWKAPTICRLSYLSCVSYIRWPTKIHIHCAGKGQILFYQNKNTLVLPRSSLKMMLSTCSSFWLTT